MKEGWVKIFSHFELYQVKIVEDILKQNNIESNIISKQDSAIPSIGEAELYAPADKAEAAIKVMRDNNLIGE